VSSYTINIEDAKELGLFFIRSNLDGEDFLLDFHYNSRDNHWYFSISKIDGTPVLSGLKVITNWYMFRTCGDIFLRPYGELIFLDNSVIPSDPSLEDLGIRVNLIYVENSTLRDLV
jgi:hypothetical protein